MMRKAKPSTSLKFCMPVWRMTRPRNTKNKPFSWSYTALADYETCPLKYAASRFYFTVPFVETAALIWGNRVHKAAERFLKNLPTTDKEALAPVEKYVTTMIRSGLRCTAEMEIALTKEIEQVSWFSREAWLRVKIDAAFQNHKRTEVKLFDWKTGTRIKDNPDQLRLYGAAFSCLFPETEKFEGKYIWTKHQQTTGMAPFERKEIKNIWTGFFARVDEMEQAWVDEDFRPTPSGLCKNYCQVTDCQYCGGRR